MRCSHGKCKRKTRVVPYCWQHAELLLKVKIRKCSWLPDGNKSLFAFSKAKLTTGPLFRKGQKVLRYEGELLTEDEISERYDYYVNGELIEGPAEYTLEYADGKFVDAIIIRGYSAFINDPKGYIKHPDGLSPNVVFRKNRWIFALRDIYNGEEILIDYGENYFA